MLCGKVVNRKGPKEKKRKEREENFAPFAYNFVSFAVNIPL
jgi:hypothetical protein